jgi:hypothetical protein
LGKRGPQTSRKVHGQLIADAAFSREISELQKQASIPDRDEAEAMHTALTARWRLHGVKLSECKDQRAGSIIGRLRMMHEAGLKAGVETPDGLSGPQYEAALKYQEVAEAHARVVCAPKGMGAADLNRVGGPSVDSAARDAKDAKVERDYEAMRTVIHNCQSQLRSWAIFTALDLIVGQDRDEPRRYGDLRVGLNALARHFELIDGRDAA